MRTQIPNEAERIKSTLGSQGPRPYAQGPKHGNRLNPMNENAENLMNENAKNTMNENAKKSNE